MASPSDNVIIRSIRDRYMADVSIAIVLLGTSTWSRRFVDWEIAAANGVRSQEALPLVLFDLNPLARARTPLPPRLTIGGAPSALRVGATQSPQALEDAVGHAIEQSSVRSPEADFAPSPLLRHDLH